jgi:hypothetical protein
MLLKGFENVKLDNYMHYVSEMKGMLIGFLEVCGLHVMEVPPWLKLWRTQWGMG